MAVGVQALAELILAVMAEQTEEAEKAQALGRAVAQWVAAAEQLRLVNAERLRMCLVF
jgi:hypothetical protein